jgi:hypothetical protein
MRDTSEPDAVVQADEPAPVDGDYVSVEVKDLTEAWRDLMRNENAWKKNRAEFAKRLLAFARKLHEVRQTYRNAATGADDDTAFGDWLRTATVGAVNFPGKEHKDDRAAFIYLGTPEFEQHVRDVIEETEARNPRVLAAHVKRRVKKATLDEIAPHATQAQAEADANEPETDEAGAADGGSKGEAADLDPCVDPADAIFSLVMLWSEPRGFAEFVQGLDANTRRLLADDDVVQTLRDLADALEMPPEAKAA